MILAFALVFLSMSCTDNLYNNWTDNLDGNVDGGDKEAPMELVPATTVGAVGWVKSVDAYGDTLKYITVRAADGRVWLQHNLGTMTVAQSAKDEASYGGAFQWGRPMDMHEQRGAAAQDVTAAYNPATLPAAMHGVNIKSGNIANNWWFLGVENDVWSAASSKDVTEKRGQDPCKIFGDDWAVPSYIEWMQVVNDEVITNLQTAFNSNLKLSAGGHRNGVNGNFYQVNNIGYYWTSTGAISTDPLIDTEKGARGRAVWFWETQVTPYKRDRRSNGYAVRCIKKSEKIPHEVDVPGKIIAHSPAVTKIYMTGPNIEVLPSGDLIAMHDHSGPNGSEAREGGNSITKVYRSRDKGNTWEYLTYFQMHMSTLFQHDGALYTLGLNPTNMVINKSTDGGETWSENKTLLTGSYHSASTPVLIANGRVWKAVEIDAGGAWGKGFESLMISAPVSSNLMEASNWTASNRLPYNASYLDGIFGGWLEGNAVQGKDGSVLNVIRVHTTSKTEEYVAHQPVSADGTIISFNESTGFHNFPGGSKKFFIRYDQATNKYITLANVIPSKWNNLETTDKMRNTLALCSSADLLNWSIDKVIVETEKYTAEAFNYVSWQFDGNDIVLVSRTSYDDVYGGAANYHDANYITFHRIANYKSLVQ